jgi:hypothetical protein
VRSESPFISLRESAKSSDAARKEKEKKRRNRMMDKERTKKLDVYGTEYVSANKTYTAREGRKRVKKRNARRERG